MYVGCLAMNFNFQFPPFFILWKKRGKSNKRYMLKRYKLRREGGGCVLCVQCEMRVRDTV